MKNEIINLILTAQQGDKASILEIINKFMPLIKKYSRELAYDQCRQLNRNNIKKDKFFFKNTWQ